MHYVSWKTSNFLLESVTLNAKIGHLYVADIELNFKKLTARQKVYNKICPPIIEKKKVIDFFERSTYQLMEHYELINDKVKHTHQLKKLMQRFFLKDIFRSILSI